MLNDLQIQRMKERD